MVHSTYNNYLTPHIPSNHHHARPFIPPPDMSSRNAPRPPVASSSPDPLQGAAQEMPRPKSRGRAHGHTPHGDTRCTSRRVRGIAEEEDEEEDDDEEEYLPSTANRVCIIVVCAIVITTDAFIALPPTFTFRIARRDRPTAPKATEQAASTSR
jgi:hypothetical protein